MITPSGDWQRLGAYVLREANDFKDAPTVAAISRKSEVSPKTVRKLIKGTPVRRDVLISLEQWLGWQPGSMESVLNGGEPTRAGDASAPMGGAEWTADWIMRQRSPELRDQVEHDLWATLATISLTYEEKLAKLHEFRSRRESRNPRDDNGPAGNTGTHGDRSK